MSKKHRGPTPSRASTWQPLVRGSRVIRPETQAYMDAHGITPDDNEVWLNDRYVVHLARHADGWVKELSIRRQDRKPARDWRDFMRIKDQLAGPEVEAVELYPARSRVVDTANQFWLWCFPPGERIPLGIEGGVVSDPEDVPLGAAQQRAFDPADRVDGFASEAPDLAAIMARVEADQAAT